ncbi:hypothetical protein Ocin01_15339 [Orchesella cincta]|uniref:Gamma-glutamylcyclotransferase n=1 Tax=Orchesella cincta TaxID=48709 RepID=A0A1D2MEN0_ORCCI|nr:hypothetical protein Ocin01_15339 [Orchesella cincta]
MGQKFSSSYLNCFPRNLTSKENLDSGEDQYIVGYGSLIKTESKNRMCENTGENIPVLITGFTRAWNCKGVSTSFSTTELFYNRMEVTHDNVSLLNSTAKLPSGKFWIYVTKPEFQELSSKKYPIIQSYVDTFLSGCLEMQQTHNVEKFTDNCTKTTAGWSNHWVNDRIFPRRPFVHEPNATKIDKLLDKHFPEEFKAIRIE